jgi:hypothetical protein
MNDLTLAQKIAQAITQLSIGELKALEDLMFRQRWKLEDIEKKKLELPALAA